MTVQAKFFVHMHSVHELIANTPVSASYGKREGYVEVLIDLEKYTPKVVIHGTAGLVKLSIEAR